MKDTVHTNISSSGVHYQRKDNPQQQQSKGAHINILMFQALVEVVPRLSEHSNLKSYRYVPSTAPGRVFLSTRKTRAPGLHEKNRVTVSCSKVLRSFSISISRFSPNATSRQAAGAQHLTTRAKRRPKPRQVFVHGRRKPLFLSENFPTAGET